MRAQGKRGGARGIESDSELESGSVGGGRRWAGWAKRRGNGPAGRKFLGREVKEEKEKTDWAEREGERENLFIF